MFKIEDIAMLIKSVSEKRLKTTLNIKELEFSEVDSHELSSNRYKGRGEKCGYMLFFKIKQTVNQEELPKQMFEVITEEFAKSLDLFYDSKYYDEPQIRESFRINEISVLGKSKNSVGVRGNVNYIKMEIAISDDYKDDIIEKVKQAIRDIKLAQLRINI